MKINYLSPFTSSQKNLLAAAKLPLLQAESHATKVAVKGLPYDYQ
jgi:hypothetical protein